MRWKGDEIEGGEGQIAEHVELPRGPFLGLQDDSGKGVCPLLCRDLERIYFHGSEDATGVARRGATGNCNEL